VLQHRQAFLGAARPHQQVAEIGQRVERVRAPGQRLAIVRFGAGEVAARLQQQREVVRRLGVLRLLGQRALERGTRVLGLSVRLLRDAEVVPGLRERPDEAREPGGSA
jgi:hypothetical protein